MSTTGDLSTFSIRSRSRSHDINTPSIDPIENESSRINSPITPNNAGDIKQKAQIENQDGKYLEGIMKKKEEIEEKSGTKLIDYFKCSIILKNEGSVARDHMANERTFLSWLRTALGFITFGIGFVQFYRLEEKSNQHIIKVGDGYKAVQDKKASPINQLSKPIGTMCIFLGLITFIFGFIRYYQVQVLLIKNYFPATRLTIIILLIIIFSILLVLLILDFKITF